MMRNVVRSRPIGRGRQAAFWLAALVIFCGLAWLFSAVLPPFVAAFVLGYLLDPVVGRMQRMGLSRTWATSIILFGLTAILVILVVLLAPMIGRQFSDFIKALPALVTRAEGLISSAGDQLQQGYVGSLLKRMGIENTGSPDLRGHAADLANRAVQWLAGSGEAILSRGAALLDILSWIIITPVVAFYLLVDWPQMLRTIDSLVPPRHRDTVWSLAHEIDLALAGFLRGQSLVCLFLAGWYGIGLSLIGLNFGLLIGLVGGLLSFIPYIGSLLVLAVSVLIAVVQGWPDWHLVALALGVVLLGQFLEGNVLSPKLVGDKVGLHPVWLIFALLAFGAVFGFTGLLVAVPVAAAAGVLLRFAARRYRESPLYTGAPVRTIESAEGVRPDAA